MEYSVNDLVRILLKKWYVILGMMLVVGAMSGVTSQLSYNRAIEQYEVYTHETLPPTSYGSANAIYDISYKATDNARYFDKDLFLQGYICAYADMKIDGKESADINLQAEAAFNELLPDASLVESDYIALIADEKVWFNTQNVLDELVAQGWGGSVSPSAKEQLSVTLQDGSLIISVRDMKDDLTEAAVDTFVEQLKLVGKEDYQLEVNAEKKSYEYTAIDQELTHRAELSQVVMGHPGAAPNMVKVFGTAAMFAFVVSCFGVLLFTFVKDNKRSMAE